MVLIHTSAGSVSVSLVRADPALACVPVVILSADATKVQCRDLTDRGITGYLTEPIGVGELLKTVDRYLVEPLGAGN